MFRIQNILFRFEAKHAKQTLFFSISLRSYLLPFRFVSLRSEIQGHPTYNLFCPTFVSVRKSYYKDISRRKEELKRIERLVQALAIINIRVRYGRCYILQVGNRSWRGLSALFRSWPSSTLEFCRC